MTGVKVSEQSVHCTAYNFSSIVLIIVMRTIVLRVRELAGTTYEIIADDN